MSHINHDEMKRYGDGALPRGEFLRVQKHLEECADCRRRLDEMYPILTVAEEVLLFEEPADDPVPEFHLNYEEHLKPFVFGTIGQIDREIVEAHVESCSDCQSDLRDLLQFHDELEREKEIVLLSKRGFWSAISDWFAAGNRKMIFVAASILFLVFAGLFWMTREQQELASDPSQLREKSNDGLREALPSTSDLPPAVDTNTETGPVNANNRPFDDDSERQIASLTFPKFLDELRQNSDEQLRGGSSQIRPITGLSPTGTAVRGSRQSLRWNAAQGITDYEVSIYDADFNRIGLASNLNSTKWQTPELGKGKLYRWQVSARPESPESDKILGQGIFFIVSSQDERRIESSQTPLQKAIALAEAGLLTESAAELRILSKKEPKSETVRRLLQQVKSYQRRLR